MDKQHPPFVAAFGRIASGLFILTARNNGQETGLLTSWVQQCSFEPPLLTVAIRQDRFLANWLQVGADFVLNVLDDSQTDMIAHFGKGFDEGEDAFQHIDIQPETGSAPVLAEALAYLDCRVLARFQPGDHILVVGEVQGGAMLNEGQPMVHVRKSGLHY
jgi:flavin reductase (DIM6/NTAB) family NADH-FMN oxidoreductase RutF